MANPAQQLWSQGKDPQTVVFRITKVSTGDAIDFSQWFSKLSFLAAYCVTQNNLTIVGTISALTTGTFTAVGLASDDLIVFAVGAGL